MLCSPLRIHSSRNLRIFILRLHSRPRPSSSVQPSFSYIFPFSGIVPPYLMKYHHDRVLIESVSPLLKMCFITYHSMPPTIDLEGFWPSFFCIKSNTKVSLGQENITKYGEKRGTKNEFLIGDEFQLLYLWPYSHSILYRLWGVKGLTKCDNPPNR